MEQTVLCDWCNKEVPISETKPVFIKLFHRDDAIVRVCIKDCELATTGGNVITIERSEGKAQ